MASKPIAVLLTPSVLVPSASAPIAVLPSPVVLFAARDRRWPCSGAAGIVQKRALAKSVVATPIHVENERISADCVVELACRVGEQRE